MGQKKTLDKSRQALFDTCCVYWHEKEKFVAKLFALQTNFLRKNKGNKTKYIDKYIDFMADTVNYVKHLHCYEKKRFEKKKICNSDIVDLIIFVLTDMCSATIIAYYSKCDMQSHI